MAKSFRMNKSLDLNCPFCLGRLTVGYSTGAYDRNASDPTIIHTVPPCTVFLDLPLEVFLTRVNDALGLHD